MTYTEETPVHKNSDCYTTTCKTPIGVVNITWDSRLNNKFVIDLDGIKHINTAQSLEEAKQFVVQYLEEKCQELQMFLGNNTLSEIENAMERWHHARDNDGETLQKINDILVENGMLEWFNEK